MVVDDVHQRWQQEPQRDVILRVFEITPERMEEPERRVRGVIKTFLLPVGKHVWNQTVADVMREGAQDVSGFERAAGRECQSFEADHRVAPPISEPVVAGDDGANFVARRVRPRRFLETARRRDDILVARENQFRGDAFTRGRIRLHEQARAPFAL